MSKDLTDKQALEKAIRIAIKNGWDVEFEDVLQVMSKRESLYGLRYVAHSGWLFNHEFCKALWGEEHAVVIDVHRPVTNGVVMSLKEYQFHMQQMVIADNPLAYLKDNLPKEDV